MSRTSAAGRGRPMTVRERDLIKNLYPQVGPTDIARKLGRSRSAVTGWIRAMKASGEIDPEASIKTSIPAPRDGLPADELRQDRLARLRALREVLHRQLLEAGPGQVARIAAEYRATMDEIERAEGAGEPDDDILERLAGALSAR